MGCVVADCLEFLRQAAFPRNALEWNAFNYLAPGCSFFHSWETDIPSAFLLSADTEANTERVLNSKLTSFRSDAVGVYKNEE